MTPTDTTPAPVPPVERPAPGPALADNSRLAAHLHRVEELTVIISGYIERNLKEGVDFGAIKGETATGKQFTGKRVLFKPGAEKLCIALGLSARFRPDFDTHQMAGNTPGLIALKCFLLDITGHVVAEARGAASAGERKGWTINNAVKVAEKRAHVAAVLRVAALSDHFVTEEEEDHQGENPRQAPRGAEKPQEPRQRSEPRSTAAPTQNAPASQRQAAPPSPKARSWKAIKTLCGDMPETEVVGELNDFLRKHIRPGCTVETATGDDWAKAAPLLEDHVAKNQPPPRPFAGPAPAPASKQTKGPTPAEVADEIFS